MPKRIGIMTWYSYENYGTVLQATALNKAIESLGYAATDIAYDPKLGVESHELRNLSLRIRALNKLKYMAGIYHFQNREKTRLFKQFVGNNIRLSPPVEHRHELRELNRLYDAFVCGSDQIWSPRCFDSAYYLDFVEDENRMVAYAPSFGCDSIEGYSAADDIASLIRRFHHISVRESSGADIVQRCIGRSPSVALDPTLLLTSEDWRTLSCPVEEDEPFCLVYFLGDNSGNWEAARSIAAIRGLNVVAIPVFERDLRRSECARYSVGPAEFLWLISHAAIVCTDSFHGMVFSTIFEREFVAFERFNPKSSDSQNTRVYSFLTMSGARGALLTRDNVRNWREHTENVLDFTSIAVHVGKKRVESIDFLRNALESASDGIGNIGDR